MSVRDAGAASFAARAAPPQAGHFGRRAGLVEEDDLRGIEVGLELESGFAPCGYVLALLLAGVRGFFLTDPVAAEEIMDRRDGKGLAPLGEQTLETGNLGAVQLLLGHTKVDSRVRYLGVELEDALSIADKIDI